MKKSSQKLIKNKSPNSNTALNVGKTRKSIIEQQLIEDEQEIKILSKKLKLDKRRSNQDLPKSIKEFGGDFLELLTSVDEISATRKKKKMPASHNKPNCNQSNSEEDVDDIDSNSDCDIFNNSVSDVIPAESFSDEDNNDGEIIIDQPNVCSIKTQKMYEKRMLRNRKKNAKRRLKRKLNNVNDVTCLENLKLEQSVISNTNDVVKKRKLLSESKVSDKEFFSKAVMSQSSIEDISVDHLESHKLMLQMKRIINRICESLMTSVTKEAELLFDSHSLAIYNQVFSQCVLRALFSMRVGAPALLDLAAFASVVHINCKRLEIGANLLEIMVKRLMEILEQEEDIVNDTEEQRIERCARCINLQLFVAFLHIFGVISSELVFDLLTMMLDKLNSIKMDVIIACLNNVGIILRKENPSLMLAFFTAAQKKLSEELLSVDKSLKEYFVFTLEAVKNNNLQKFSTKSSSINMPSSCNTERLDHYVKLLRTTWCNTKHTKRKEDAKQVRYNSRMTLRLKDLLEAEVHGRWWIIGSAFNPSLSQEPLISTSEDNHTDNAVVTSEDPVLLRKLSIVGVKLGLINDYQRAVLRILITSESAEDAVFRLLCRHKEVNLGQMKEREMIWVILQCVKREKKFNLFYAVILELLCKHKRKFVMMVRCAFYDELSSYNCNIAATLAYLILAACLSLTILEKFSFIKSESSQQFIKILFDKILIADLNTLINVFMKAISQSKSSSVVTRILVNILEHNYLNNVDNPLQTKVRTLLRLLCHDLVV